MGLLEQLMARLEKLNARLDRLEGTALGTLEANGDGSGESAPVITGDSGVVVDNGVKLQKGIPWDERIHAGTKTITAKGEWTRKKGITDELFESVVAELTAKYAGSTVTDTPAAGPGKPGAPVKPGTPAAGPAKPGAPVKPGTPAAPAGNTDKHAATAAVNKLTAKGGYAVNYDIVWAMLQETYGVDTFDALPVDAYPEIRALLEGWLETLSRVQDEVKALTALGEANPTSAEDIKLGVETYQINYGGDGVVLGSVPKENLEALLTDLSAYADEWEAFLKG